MRDKRPKTDDLLDAQQVCALAGFSMRTLLRRVKNKQLVPLPKPPGLQRHHKMWFSRADVESHLRSIDS